MIAHALTILQKELNAHLFTPDNVQPTFLQANPPLYTEYNPQESFKIVIDLISPVSKQGCWFFSSEPKNERPLACENTGRA